MVCILQASNCITGQYHEPQYNTTMSCIYIHTGDALIYIILGRTTTNISANNSTPVVFRVAQLNIIRGKHIMIKPMHKKYMQDDGRQETQDTEEHDKAHCNNEHECEYTKL